MHLSNESKSTGTVGSKKSRSLQQTLKKKTEKNQVHTHTNTYSE